MTVFQSGDRVGSVHSPQFRGTVQVVGEKRAKVLWDDGSVCYEPIEELFPVRTPSPKSFEGPRVHLWLMVHEQHDGPGYGFPSRLWTRDVVMWHTPSVGDYINLFSDSESEDGSGDGSGDVPIDVRNRYWGHDGVLNLELRRIVHLPNEKMEQDLDHRIRLWIQTEHGTQMPPQPWREEDERLTPLVAELESSGWRRYGRG